jgi:DHA2 family multidrug resistance protein-like MFS transporter
MTTTPITPRAGRREWTGLAVLALPTMLLALDVSVLYLALPHLSADLGAGSTQQLWISDIYGFMIAGFLVTMGTLGDRIGRRRLLLIGASAFGVASVAAAWSSSPEMLIVTRAALGIAGATLMPSTLALISNMFRDPKQQGTAIAIWLSCFMGGGIIGPVVGGALLERFWWGSAFLLGVPVMILLLLTGPKLLPEYRDPDAGRVDLASVALSLAAILPIVYGLKELAKDGPALTPAGALIAGAAFGLVFARRQRRLPNPLIDVRLFANRGFSAALLINLLVGGLMGGIGLLLSMNLQLVEALPPLRAGLWQVPGALTMIAATMLAPVLARRSSPGTVMASGLALAAIGFLLLTQVGSGAPLLLAAAYCVIAAGIGIGIPLGTGLVLGAAPPEKAGSASAMSETGAELGIALGVALLGSVGASVYRAAVELPAGLPAGAAGAARESIAGAVAVAGRLPAALGTELLDGARAAFLTAMHSVAGLGAVVLIGLAVVAVTQLRERHPAPESAPESAPEPEEVPVAA